MIRGVGELNSQLKHVYSKKDTNKRKNAFSLAFLRKDQLFSRFPRGYESGFIIYPHLKTPKGKNEYDVLCAFPVDANTEARYGKHGCGASFDDKTGESKHCNDQNIKSIKKWILHYKTVMKRNPNFVAGQSDCY